MAVKAADKKIECRMGVLNSIALTDLLEDEAILYDNLGDKKEDADEDAYWDVTLHSSDPFTLTYDFVPPLRGSVVSEEEVSSSKGSQYPYVISIEDSDLLMDLLQDSTMYRNFSLRMVDTSEDKFLALLGFQFIEDVSDFSWSYLYMNSIDGRILLNGHKVLEGSDDFI